MEIDGKDDNADLIHRAQAGDVVAFQQLAESQSQRLCRCAVTFCRDRQWAEDIAQETLIEAWRSLGRFDGRCQFSSWLYGIMRHRFLKACRLRANAAMIPLPEALAETLHHCELSPESATQQSEDALRVRQAVAELPNEHRQVIELRFFAELSLEEIVVALDCPLGTVKSRLHYGLEKLRKLNLAMNFFNPDGESLARRL